MAHQSLIIALGLWLASAALAGEKAHAGQEVPPAPPSGIVPAGNPEAAERSPAPLPALRVLRTGGLKVESAALLLSGQQGGPLPIAVLALPFPGGGDKVRVPVVIEISGPGLLAGMGEAAEGLLHLEVAVYALGEGNHIAGSLADTIEVDLAALEPALAQGGLRFWGELALLPGSYSLRVLVRRHGSTTDLGLRALPLAVPEPQQTALLTPLIESPDDAPWLTVRASSGDPAKSLASPLSLLQREAFPEASAVAEAPGDLSVQVPAFGLPPAGIELQAELQKDGAVVGGPIPVTLGERRASGISGLEIATGRLALPPLPAGEYQLRLQGADVSSPPLTVHLVHSAGSPRPIWAVLGRVDGEAAVADLPARAGHNGRLPRAEAAAFENGYRAALLRLAEGDAASARQSLAGLEKGLLERHPSLALDDMAMIELRVLRQISKSNPEALLPILKVYGEIYREASAQRAFLRSTHARQLLFTLADHYSSTTSSDEGRKGIARFLVGFAAELARGAEPGGLSTAAFKRTLDIDPTDEVALLCLAIDAERRGDYRAALPYLEQLAKSHPGSREGKVRLAVNLSRLDKRREAKKLFAELATGSDWTAEVASQELARLLLAEGKLAEAETFLTEARRRFPQDEKLAFQLASLLDRQAKPRQAAEILASFQPAAGTTRSARLRYADLPEEAIRRAMDDFAELAKPRLMQLQKVLAGSTAGDVRKARR